MAYTILSVILMVILTSFYLICIALPTKGHISAGRYLFFHSSYLIVIKTGILFIIKYQYMIVKMSKTKHKEKYMDWNFVEKLNFVQIRKIAYLDLEGAVEPFTCSFCDRLIEFEDWLESNRCDHKAHMHCGKKNLKCNGGYCSVGECRANWWGRKGEGVN
jgi:hypothetical protein